jgi:glycine/D-amino acid oxidase-like deaminating enzyme
MEDQDPHIMINVMRELFPDSLNKMTLVMPCYYSVSKSDEFIFERKGNTVYGFGLCGRGFKHMPYHGKRIYHLISGNYKEANKYAL